MAQCFSSIRLGKYKQNENSKETAENLDNWLNQIREIIENQESNALDFLDEFKMNLYAKEVFAFTPKGLLK